MNIFAVHNDPVIAAQSLIDRHVVKMPSESCIMLANAYPLDVLANAPLTQKGNVRGHGYPHHGCTKWAKLSYENYKWLLDHSIGLCEEYTYRTGNQHFCSHFILWCKKNPPVLDSCGLTPHYLAMPDEHKCGDVVQSYRSYYTTAKQVDKRGKPMYVWSKRQKPSWA